MEQEQKETTKDSTPIKPLPLDPEELKEIQSELRIS